MISIVMPAHNEEEYLEPAVKAVIAGMESSGQVFEVIIAENGSTDRTDQVISSLVNTCEGVSALRLPKADYGAALRSGFLAARGDIVVNFDVDFVDLAFLTAALQRFRNQDVALVVGSKRAPGSLDRRSLGRRTVTTVFSLILRHGFGLMISDTHGIKAMRRELVEPFVRASTLGQDMFDTELILRLERAGLRVEEIPVAVEEIRPARTPISRRILRSLFRLLRLRLELWRRSPSTAPDDSGPID